MKQNQKVNEEIGSIMKPNFARTEPQKVQQQIQQDIKAGQGAMTSREAGAMHD